MSIITLAMLCCLAIAHGGDPVPRTLRDHVQPEVGYVHSAIPLEAGLTRAEVERWISLLGASDEQATAIRALHAGFLADQYNPFVDRAAPEHLLKSAAASAALGEHGMASDEFRAAWRNVDRSARSLTDMSMRLEHLFIAAIEAVEPALESEQLDAIQILRGFSTRRHARAVSSSNRWVALELRRTWGDGHLGRLSDADRSTVLAMLADYEFELTSLLEQWSRSHLDASRRMQDYLGSAARGQDGTDRPGPDRIWARPAGLIKRLRSLHLRVAAEMLDAIDEGARHEARLHVVATMYPELYPDREYERVLVAFDAAISDGSSSPEPRATIGDLRDRFERRYAELSRKLESTCDEWDDRVASGVGSARSQGLVPAITPLLAERAKLHEEFLAALRSEVAMVEERRGD